LTGFVLDEMLERLDDTTLHWTPTPNRISPDTRHFVISMVARLHGLGIFGGTNEIMKEIIGRSLGL
jgi:hypothetical protein